MVMRSVFVLLLLGWSGACLAEFAQTQDAVSGNVRSGSSPLIIVEQPDEPRDSHGITIEYSLSTRTIMTRQMMKIHYRIQSNDAFITLRAETEPVQGETYITLLTRKTPLPQSSTKRYQYDLNVVFTTSESGAKLLRIPSLIYSEGGKDRYRFNFKAQTIKVTSLPSYLPPYTPMVPLKIESSFSQSWSWLKPLNTDEVYYWTLSMQAETADETSLPDIRQQLSSDHSIRFLPAEISRDTIKQHDQLVQTITYIIPFVINKSSVVSLPGLSFRHFDPLSRRLASTTYQIPNIVALNRYLRWILWILIVIACVIVFWKLRPAVVAIYISARDFYRARRLVLQSQSALQVRTALKCLGLSWGWSDNLSLQQWGLLWQRDIDQSMDMMPALERLAYCLYGGGEDKEGLQQLQTILVSSYVRQWLVCIKAALRSSRQGRH